MKEIKNIVRLQELLVLIAGVAVMLIIPFLGIQRILVDDLIQNVFLMTVAFMLGGDVRKALIPFLAAVVKLTPTTKDDEAFEIIVDLVEDKPKAG